MERKSIYRVIIYSLISALVILLANTNKAFFDFADTPNKYANIYWCVCVGITILVLCFVTHKVMKIAHGLLKRDRYSQIFCTVCMVIMFLFVALAFAVKPGNWGFIADEIYVYYASKKVYIWYSQGFISSIFMMIPLMLYPKAQSVVLMEAITFAAIVSKLLSDSLFNLRRKWLLVFYVALLLSPAMLAYMLCPIRGSYFCIVTLLLTHRIYNSWNQVNLDVATKIVIFIDALLVSVLRTEGIIILFFTIVYLVYKASSKRARLYSLIVFCMGFIMFKACYAGLTNLGGGYTPRQHALVSYVSPLSMILSDDKRLAKIDKEDLKNIDAVFPIDTMLEYPSETTTWEWHYGTRSFQEPTKNEAKLFKESATKICISNYDVYLKCRIKSFLHSVALSDEISIYWWGNDSFRESEYITNIEEFSFSPYRENVLFTIINLRNRFGNKWFYVFYAFWIPMLVNGILFIKGIIRKNCRSVAILFVYFMTLGVVIITAPARYNMYYLMFYVVGWYLIFNDILPSKEI